jgi:hypothetical protein
MNGWFDYTIATTSVFAAVASAVTAGFVGWQTSLLSETLDDPFQANLQNRQIDACIGFLKHHNLELPSVQVSERIVADLAKDSEEIDRSDDTDRSEISLKLPDEIARKLLDLKRKDLEDLKEAIGELNVFATEATSRQIARAQRAAVPQNTDFFGFPIPWSRDLPKFEGEPKYKQELEVSDFSDPSWSTLGIVPKNYLDLKDYETEAAPLVERCYDIMEGRVPGLL